MSETMTDQWERMFLDGLRVLGEATVYQVYRLYRDREPRFPLQSAFRIAHALEQRGDIQHIRSEQTERGVYSQVFRINT